MTSGMGGAGCLAFGNRGGLAGHCRHRDEHAPRHPAAVEHAAETTAMGMATAMP